MYGKVLLLVCAINYCLGQSINSPALDWIQTDESGAYRFGYATGDEGRHYHVSSATADNTVAGRFGYKDPVTGGDLQTTYTAGRRGFRARGPHIARRMDLSQNKPPFSRPDDDGKYHPELDNVFDPNEDRGYDFSYRTPDHIKEEHADRAGDVQGRYSYLDDIGFRHNVEYIAGSKTGFVVTNPVPDTFARARGGPLYFVGKSGGSKVRGFSAVQKNLNGAYRFLASGPDHKRSEISDASGNRRGVYTYLDDKGVQHTVEYIAGPKIGYKVINNKKGVNYNPVLPFFPDSPTVQPLFPSSPGVAGGVGSKPLGPVPARPTPTIPSTGDDLFSGVSPSGEDFPVFPVGGGLGGGGGSSSTPLLPSVSPTKPSGSRPLGNRPLGETSGRPPSLFKPSGGRPSSGRPTSGEPSNKVPPFSFEQPEDFPPIAPVFPSTTPFPIPAVIPARPQKPPGLPGSDPKWNYDYDYFINDPSTANKDWSKPIKGQSGADIQGGVSSTPKNPFTDFLPSPFPDPGYLAPTPFDENLNTAESGNGLKPPFPSRGKDDCNNSTGYNANKGTGSNRQDSIDRNDQRGPAGGSGRKSTNDGPAKHYYKGTKSLNYPSRGTVKFGGVKKSEWHRTRSNDEDDGEFFAIPPGVAVRAHVQSLDIVPFDKRFVSPGEALEHHEGKKHAND